MRNFFILVAAPVVWVLLFSSVSLGYQDYIWVYRDSNYTEEATVFDDGDTVYVKVTNWTTQSTPASVTVTNVDIGNSIDVSVTNSETPEISADPTIFFGKFIVNSWLSDDANDKLRIFDGQKATISADLDNDDKAATAQITAMYIPPAPPNLQAVPVAPKKIKLTWDASNPEDTVVQYNVYRGTSSGGENYTTPIATVSATGPSSYEYTDSGLTAGQTYYYTVKSQDKTGDESESSNEVSATAKQELIIYRTVSKIVRSGSPLSIVFSVSKQADIFITVLNLNGERVREEKILASPGVEIEWTWSGKNMYNTAVNNGVYILLIKAVATDGEEQIKRRVIGVLY